METPSTVPISQGSNNWNPRGERIIHGTHCGQKMRALINVYSSLPNQDRVKPTVQRDSTYPIYSIYPYMSNSTIICSSPGEYSFLQNIAFCILLLIYLVCSRI